MDEIVRFVQESKVFFIASVDGDSARVRPFAFIMQFESKLYFTTGNQKKFYRQAKANPNLEFCAMHPDGRWLRVSGQAVFDGNAAAKAKAFEVMPGLAEIYKGPDAPDFEVFYLDKPAATIYSMTAPAMEVKI